MTGRAENAGGMGAASTLAAHWLPQPDKLLPALVAKQLAGPAAGDTRRGKNEFDTLVNYMAHTSP